MKKKLFKGFLPIVLALMLAVSVGSVAAFAEDDEPEVMSKYGWNVHSGTLDSTPKGMTFGSEQQGAAYGFSATTNNTVKARELALNLRIRDNVYSDAANAEIIIGLSDEKGDFTAADASGYGIILQPTAENVYNAWLVKPNKAATAVPGYDNITVITGVTLSETGTLSVLFHRESATRWMIMMNGWAIDNNADVVAAPGDEPEEPGDEPIEPVEPTEPEEPIPADPDNITEEEQGAIDEWQTAHAAWEIEHAAWVTAQAAWETEHAAWQTKNDAYDAWLADKAAYDAWLADDGIQAKAAANAALEAMDDVYLTVAARDSRDGEKQTMQVELYQADGKMLGTKKDTQAVFTNNLHGHESPVAPEYTADGIVAKGTPELRMGVTDKLSGSLDGYAMSVVVEPGENTNYSIDLGVGTAHGAGRFTFWDTMGAPQHAPIAYSLAVRITSGNDIVYGVLRGTADQANNPAKALLFNGAIKFAPRADGRITVAFNKVGVNWKVYVNGREIPAHNADDGTVFQTFLNEAMDAMNATPNPEAVSPWIMSYVNNDPATEFKYTFTGYGTCPLGKMVDDNIGNVADEITGELEFSSRQWTAITPADTLINLRIEEDGFYADGMARKTGFAIGVCYNRNLASVNGLTATFKMPEKVKASGGAIHGYYGMFIGSMTNRNFTDQDSLLIRFSFDTEDPTQGATVAMINWDKTNDNVNYAECSAKVDPKTEEGKESEYTVHIAYYEEAATYRIYVNGQRVSNLAFEEKITEALANMEQKYFYLNGSYEQDNVGGAWVEEDDEPIGFTLVSLSGDKIVNKVAEPIHNAFTLNDGEEITANSVKLSWTKGEYPVGAMDAYNFVPHHYIIERIKGDAEEPEKTITVEGDMDTLTYTDTNLDADTKYYYTVYAVDESGNNKLLRSNANKRVATLKGDNGNAGDNNGDTSGDNNGGTTDTESKKKKCGSSAASACGAAAAALLVAAGITLASKKRRNA